MMNWKSLEKTEQLGEIDELSKTGSVLIFKHSTRCNVSATALDRLERKEESLPTAANYYLDLIAFRSISNEIATRYQVIHESPQAIIIRNGRAVHVTTHFDIRWEDLNQAAAAN